MYKIIKVGIPIQTIGISKEFLDSIEHIKTGNAIGVTTVDYYQDNSLNFEKHIDTKSSIAGHKVLFDNLKFYKYIDNFIPNSINNVGIIWSKVVARDKHQVTKNLINILDTEYTKLKYDTVYIFATGSPYHMDIFTDMLPTYKNNIEIIDTKSAFDICIDKMKEYIGLSPEIKIHRYKYFIVNDNPILDLNKLNIFGSISNDYEWKIKVPLLEHFFRTMDKLVQPFDIFMFATVDEDSVKFECVPYEQAERLYTIAVRKHLPFVIGIYKGRT